MIEIKNTKVGSSQIQTVSAAALHGALNTKSAFLSWVQYRIERGGYVSGIDYEEVLTRAFKRDYNISLKMAHSFADIPSATESTKVKAFLSGFLCEADRGTQAEVRKVAKFAAPPALKGVKTMSSVEIVEVINALRGAGKAELRHDHFIVKLESHPGITHPNFRGSYSDPTGRTVKCYYLPKREAELMVMSESLEVQTKVYDRLAELEAAPQPVMQLPLTYAEALRKLADSAELAEKQTLQIEQQAVKIEAAAPAVAFVEKYVSLDGRKTFRQVAKLLSAPELEFRNFLLDRKFMYHLNREYLPYSVHEKAGHFVVKTSVVEGTTRIYTYFTPKGIEHIAKKWNERVPMLRKPAYLASSQASS